ncbi:hypothetical protein PTTG_28591 [Puccinia triticina 1-1 BBBD Race 1]|uniref:Uncharacterized protein n=1 Tax=Puccinia triticina (isolate 1-1 / race 1 (BBBD)) TaxID=630390 RepID=A0A180GAJ7_PUCT1|nr:hypothetical protein PTTG_28591 [Puccinia triticina 1-1 BBBD Race 1]
MHLENLPSYLRPDYSQAADKTSDCANERQIDGVGTVKTGNNSDRDEDETEHQRDSFHATPHLHDIYMEAVEYQDDRSNTGESDSKDELLNMWEAIDIFQPASQVDKGMEEEDEAGEGEEEEPEVKDQGWYPFAGLAQLVSILLTGYMHTILSRMQHDKVCSLAELCGLELCCWTSVWRAKAKLRDMLNMNPNQRESVFKNQCYSLSVQKLITLDLANPYVSPHLDSYPVDSGGKNIYKLSQSDKQGWAWREELPREYRAQMVAINKKHYYIYEPCQLHSGELVVPIFFYKQEDKMYAKCAKLKHDGLPQEPKFKMIIPKNLPYKSPRLLSIACEEFSLNYFEICMWGDKPLSLVCKNTIWEEDHGSFTPISLPNDWREKSGNRIIRHVPIALYCDDTSGNQSKKWNKHISYYFTLAGLPPKLSNQQYNCHFLSTSNTAGPLELADQIVDELNDMTLNGCVAFDCELQQEVCVTTVVLCFLGDSPMHAEITNTPLPGAALNPCRICHLGVEKRSDKSGEDYIYQFLGMDSLGNRDVVDYRSWSETIERSYELWETAVNSSRDAYITESKALGVQDAIKKAFVDMLKDRKKAAEFGKIMRAILQDTWWNTTQQILSF